MFFRYGSEKQILYALQNLRDDFHAFVHNFGTVTRQMCRANRYPFPVQLDISINIGTPTNVIEYSDLGVDGLKNKVELAIKELSGESYEVK